MNEIVKTAAPEFIAARRQEVEDLINREADLMDRHQWNEWLELYTEDCVFWIPSWNTEEEMISDPEVEINTMYIVGRAGLEARVFRMTSRDSYASLPLAWTSHVIGTIRLLGQNEAGDLTASAKWLVLSLDSRRGKMVRGGWYDYALSDTPQGLRIRSKKITLLESMIDGTIDVFQV
jgi:3-phenylpropionate/cinnamic acid dioxygenase small subunit